MIFLDAGVQETAIIQQEHTVMRNLFLSFLGNNWYIPCNYVLGETKINNVRFVQEALVRLLCADFKKTDSIIVFLTEEARAKNWYDSQDNNHPVSGLESILDDMGKGDMVVPVDIPDGRSPEELWEIFIRVFAAINDNDHVIFDITHGFRSLPMLGMVLLNYARLLKNITIAGIYYGAFEVLGPAWKVNEIPIEERNALIFDLSDFATLLAWSSGVQEFVRHGSPAGIAELLQQAAKPRLGASKGKDNAAKIWNGVGHHLKEIGGQIATCRGREIAGGEAFARLRSYLGQCAGFPDLPAPFRPLIDTIAAKVEPFHENDLENCLRAVEWCIEHDLTQQGITLLQEGVVSLIVQRHGLDWKLEKDRTLVSEALCVMGKKILEAEWRGELKMRPDLARQMITDPLTVNLVKEFDKLSKARNDLNHGGFTEPKQAKAMKKTLQETYAAISEVWKKFKGTPCSDSADGTTQGGE